MAKAVLKTNYVDDVLAPSMNDKRQYMMTINANGTRTLDDVTEYSNVGSYYGAAHINATNQAVNASLDTEKVIDDLSTVLAVAQPGYLVGALALKAASSVFK